MQQLVADPMQAQAPARQVAVDLVPGVHHHLHPRLARQQHVAVHATVDGPVLRIEQEHAVDARRHGIDVVAEAQPDGVALVAMGADDQMGMRLRVDRAQRVAGLEARAAHHPHVRGPAAFVVFEQEARAIEIAALRGASHPQVQEGQFIHADALGLVAEAEGGQRRGDLGRHHGKHRRADIAAHVQPVVQVAAAFAAEVSAHLAQRADHLVPAVLRRQRPAPLRRGEGPVRARTHRAVGQRRARGIQGPRHQRMQPVPGRVGQQQAAVVLQPQPRDAREPLRGIAAGQHPRATVGCDLQDAAGRGLADVEDAVVRDRQRQRPPQRDARGRIQSQRRHPAAGVDPAQRMVAGIGHPQAAVGGERQRGGRVESGLRAGPVGKAARGPGQGTHAPVGFDHADAVVPGVGHVDPAQRVHRHAHRCAPAREHRRPVAQARRAIAGQGSDLALRRDAADGMVAAVGDIQRAMAVDRQAGRGMEARGRAASVGQAFGRAREARHPPVRRDPADAVGLAPVADEHAAIAGAHQCEGFVEARLQHVAVAQAAQPGAGQRHDARVPVQ